MVLSLAAHAQQLHFIYIQADNKQPFSVELNGKYYSSSSIGYIILPKLTDGTYNLKINFAKNSYPEQNFTVNVNGKDYGYALKSFDNKGWGLFNYQTTDVVMSDNAAATSDTASPQGNQPATVTNNSAFGAMLADVVNDKSINTLSTADTATTKDKAPVDKDKEFTVSTTFTDTVVAAFDTVTNAIAQNENASKDTDTLKETAKADTSSDTPEFNTTGVIKAEENESEKGTDLTFIDFNGEHSDTIKAFIPAAGEKKSSDKTDTLDVNDKATAADSANEKVNNPFFGQDSTGDSAKAINQSKVTEDNQPATTAPANSALVNANCSNMLTDGDLNKLKKRIISESDQDAILQTVKKSLKNKCITTDQVKDLGNLFLNDDNRYGFYDAVYPFVYDFGNFTSLQNTLIDPYYKSRFKALLR
jgi:hypothetical protein